MDALAKTLAEIFAADPTWYASAGQAQVPLPTCRAVLDWAADPSETSPETDKAVAKVVTLLYETGRLPLSNPVVAEQAMALL